jgi:8-oxo-dGTP pyrophosphatase MutT (NUDIX family)
MMNDLVTCFDYHENEIRVSKSDLVFRPSVYGVVVQEGKLLCTVIHPTGKWMVPGGGIEIGEPIEEALKREIREECGIEVTVGEPLFFKERFFYFEPTNVACQGYLFFYACTPITFDVHDEDHDDEKEHPQWVDIATLKSADFQVCGEQIMKVIG